MLAALLHRVPGRVLISLHLIVKPETVLRWHRELVAHRHAEQSRPKRAGRPRTARPIRILVLRPVRDKPRVGI